jgi:hypothetical protein
MLAPGAFGFLDGVASGGEGQNFRARDGVAQVGNGVCAGSGQGRLKDSETESGSFLNADAMLSQDGHVQLKQEFEILHDSAGPFAGQHAIETVTADIRSLVKAFVEELHECRTFQRQRRTRKTHVSAALETSDRTKWHLAAGSSMRGG